MRFEFVENESRHISGEQMDFLADLLQISEGIRKGLGLKSAPLEILGDKARFNGISANIRFHDTELIVRPKVAAITGEGGSIDSRMRTLYLRILKTCKSNLNSVIYFTGASAVASADNSFIDCIAQYYLDNLAFALGKLPILVYRQREEERSSLKGKILIQKELQSPVRNGKTWCRYKALDRDNQYNALLKWCCEYFEQNVGSRNLKCRLRQMAGTLAGDGDALSVAAVRPMRLPRNFDAYKEPFSIAKDFFLYNSQTARLRTDGRNICGYVINMATAFENIVCYYAERFSLKNQMLHVAQADAPLATADNGNANMNYHIRPDDMLVKDGYKLVLDAKYKHMTGNEKPSREDFYQMVSSCIAHGTDEAILMYPGVGISDDYSGSWTVLNPFGGVNGAGSHGVNFKVYADKIDIFSDEQAIIGQISKAICRSRFGEAVCGKISDFGE